MSESLPSLFSSPGLMPHGHCYLWTPGIVWLHVISDAMIVLAYYSIPVLLVYFVKKRKDLTFSWIFVCFAIFILACGTTHLLEIWNVWHSDYWLSGAMKALTAAASVPTAIILARLIPSALAIPSPEALRSVNAALEQEIQTRRAAEEHGRTLNAELEQRVDQRTAELNAANGELLRQIAARRQADHVAEEALRASEMDFRASFHSSAVGQAQVAPDTGRYLRVNAKFCEICGYSEEELLQMTFMELTHPDDRPADAEAHERMVHGQNPELSREKRYLHKDGKAVWVHINASIIRDHSGRPIRTLAVIQDVSGRRRIEAELHQLNADLELRVMDRTKELEMANKELEAFSYSVSHDLRAPLRAVDGFSQAVVEDYGPLLPEEGRRFLQRIRDGAQKMGALIDDLLTFSRLSRAPLHKKEVNSGALVAAALDDLRSFREGRRMEIRVGVLPPCRGDSALLKQVWINLLSNALKYTQKREDALVEIGCASESGEHIYFVKDNGSGFDMRYAGKLFGVFQRLHLAEDYEGTGVGLAIVQRIVHRHGGRIWVEAELDRGAAFYFTLEEESQS